MGENLLKARHRGADTGHMDGRRETITIVEAMTADLQDDGTVTGLSHWTKGGHERTYIRVSGFDAGYKGCRSHQLYWDHRVSRLMEIRGPGMTPSTFDESVARVVAAFADVAAGEMR